MIVHILILIGVVVSFLVCYWYGSRILGKSIEAFVERVDKEVLGVDINIGSMKVSLCSGRVEIEDISIQNPPGFEKENLLAASRMIVDVKVWQYVKQLCRGAAKQITIEEIALVDVLVNLETRGTSIDESNLGVLLANVQGDEEADSSTTSSDEETAATGDALNPKQEDDDSPEMDVLLEKVHVSNILVKVGQGMLGMTLAVADIIEDDFKKKHGKLKPIHIVRIVLRTLLKSVTYSFVGGASKVARRCCDLGN
mmetsp:Transcript_58701/g.164710  ORF Transcript_58701/g.164710 Transcript_58701/m.164710 type:complete len:254 (-) Transcript_58701:64-825(-)